MLILLMNSINTGVNMNHILLGTGETIATVPHNLFVHKLFCRCSVQNECCIYHDLPSPSTTAGTVDGTKRDDRFKTAIFCFFFRGIRWWRTCHHAWLARLSVLGFIRTKEEAKVGDGQKRHKVRSQKQMVPVVDVFIVFAWSCYE